MPIAGHRKPASERSENCRRPTGLLGALAGILFLVGCVGMVDDYSKTALAFGQSASGNTIENLSAKHDLEAAVYAALYCREMRVGAERRRYRDPTVLMERLRLCDAEEQIGFGP